MPQCGDFFLRGAGLGQMWRGSNAVVHVRDESNKECPAGADAVLAN